MEIDIENKKKLLDDAKKAYYSGNPIMSDQEFDELETDLGLENDDYVGTKSSSKHTVNHPFLMGSLSKVQVKEDKNSKKVDWTRVTNEIRKYLMSCKNPSGMFQIEPKYDGCSFELNFDLGANSIKASSRGDGNKGQDLTRLFFFWLGKFKDDGLASLSNLKNHLIESCDGNLSNIVIRGEILAALSIFDGNLEAKSSYSSPRAMVAGLTGCDFDDLDEIKKNLICCLNFLVYDIRTIDKTGKVTEINWKLAKASFDGFAYPDDNAIIDRLYAQDILDPERFEQIYDWFEKYRNNLCEYPLDGFVIKPEIKNRISDVSRARPKDEVAVKFKPEIAETMIVDIEWNLGKTGEWFPTGIVKPVFLQNKEVIRVSLHGYSTLLSKEVGIGSNVKISMAGDIIPFLYEVMTKSVIWNIPSNSTIMQEDNGTMHLISESSVHSSLYWSFMTLKIPGIGPALAKRIEDNNDLSRFKNAIELMSQEGYSMMLRNLGHSKTILNAIEEMKICKASLDLQKIILSCNLPGCGPQTAKACTEWMINEKNQKNQNQEVFNGLSCNSYSWVLDKNSDEYKLIDRLVDISGIKIKDVIDEESRHKIKVILTGKPSTNSYKDKKDFLRKHPELEETTKWNEVEMLITDSLDSTSSKMEKAKNKGIEIITYEIV